MYVPRLLEPEIFNLSKSFPTILLTGPRQVGKTTLLEHAGGEAHPARHYVSLDEFEARSLALKDPGLFLQRHPFPVTIDEIQHAPGLLDRLKPLIDRAGAPGVCWLTGSQHFELMHGVSESMAGRIAVMKLLGLSQGEEYGVAAGERPFRPDRASPPPAAPGPPSTLLDVFARIVRGSFPRFLRESPPPWDVFFGSYVQTYLERDLRSLSNVTDLHAFGTFLRLASARVGQVLNLSDLARDAQVPVPTAKSWLGLLEAGFQVVLVRPYFRNIGQRQIKAPKLYFLDTGLAAYLTGWTNPRVAASGAMAGALFENYVVVEVLKSYWHRGKEAPLWYWRSKEREEVDLILDEEGLIHPIEVKLSSAPATDALVGIRKLRRLGALLGRGAVVCLAQDAYPLDREVNALPVSWIR